MFDDSPPSSSFVIQTRCYRCHCSNRRRHHTSHRKYSHSCEHKHTQPSSFCQMLSVFVLFHTLIICQDCGVRRSKYLACLSMSVTDLQVEAVGPWMLLVDANHHQLPQLPSSGWIVLQLILLPVRIHKQTLKPQAVYKR